MPWKVKGLVEERWQFVMESQKEERSLTELCRECGISRQTGYTWLARYKAEGLAGLQDRSRAPHHHGNEVAEAVKEEILELRAKHGWGARKIRGKLVWQGYEGAIPAHSTIGLILAERGLVKPPRRRARARRRGEPLAAAEEPNRIWCADFKGWFRSGDGKRCDPLTLSDASSRYLLRCQLVEATDERHARPVFETAFREYGLPERMRTDNGAPFGSNGDCGLTRLAVWWIKLGIRPERIRPGHPEENGRLERLHLTLKLATATPPASSWRQQQRRFDRFRREYNEERPHEALGQVPPAEFYRPSMRAWPERVPEVSYGPEKEVRRVAPGGQIKWRGERVFVSHALEGEPVGLEQIGERAWWVHFSFYEVGVLEERRSKLWTPEQWRKRAAKES